MVLHCWQNQGITTQKSQLDAQISSFPDVLGINRQNMNSDCEYLVNCLAKCLEFAYFLGMAFQSIGDSCIGPIEGGASFQRHQALGRIVKNMG